MGRAVKNELHQTRLCTLKVRRETLDGTVETIPAGIAVTQKYHEMYFDAWEGEEGRNETAAVAAEL